MPDAERRLLAAIAASPGDPGPIDVYADWLTDRGDPRGELIRLQQADDDGTLRPDGRRRLRALLDAHRDAWLGAIGPLVAKGATRWHLGRPVAVRLVSREPEVVLPAIGAPEWASVEEIEIGALHPTAHDAIDALLAHPALAGLLRLDGPIPASLFWRWVDGPPRPLVHLAFQGLPFARAPLGGFTDANPAPDLPPELERRLFEAPDLPVLRSFALRQAVDVPTGPLVRLLQSPFGRRLRAVEVWTAPLTLGAWVALLAGPLVHLERLTLTAFLTPWRFTLRRAGARFDLDAEATGPRVFGVGPTSLTPTGFVARALDGVRPGLLRVVSVRFAVDPEDGPALADAVERATGAD